MQVSCIPVVIGNGSYNDLGCIRSLGEKGVQSIYITDGEHIIPIKKSKYLLSTYITDIESNVAECIKDISMHYEKKLVIIPTSDIAAAEIDSHYQELSRHAICPNCQGKTEYYMNKSIQATVALQVGFSVPNFAVYQLQSDSVPFNDIKFPCIIKPLLSIKGSKSHITKCFTIEELKHAIGHYTECEEYQVMIQDLADTKGQQEICITGVSLPSREIIIGGWIEKYRMIGNGSTTFGKFHHDMNPCYAEKVKQLIREMGFTGIFDIECFLSTHNELIFIECNLRNGAYGYATSRAGINLPWIYFANSAGMPCQKDEARDLVFMEERSDFLHVRNKDVTMAQWIKDVLRTDVFLTFNKHDISPIIRVPQIIKNHLYIRK